MSPPGGTLDIVDHAFLTHAASVQGTPVSGVDRDPDGNRDVARPRGDVRGDRDDIVGRLLRAVPDDWGRVARRVEQARRAGAVVIAVAGGCHGEGRTTVVRCLARVLEDRGWTVQCHDAAPVETAPTLSGGDARGIVLVDAGIWFPSGPLRRAWLQRQSLGCHAALLVRRDDQPEYPERVRTLEAAGVQVLGEIVTRIPMERGVDDPHPSVRRLADAAGRQEHQP